jgi:hypothetical protein
VRRFLHALLALALSAAQAQASPQGRWAKPRPRKPHPVDADEGHKLWYWIEDHLEIVFPAVGIAVILLVIYGVRRGMMQADDEIAVRTRQKEAIIRLMRAKLLVNAETVAHELTFDRFHAAALLEELAKEGVLIHARVAGGVASYRLKGL